jgi:hypothetical protein
MVRPDFLPVTLMLISRYREGGLLEPRSALACGTPAPYSTLEFLARGPVQNLVYVRVLNFR